MISDVAEAIAQLYVDMLRGVPGHSQDVTSIVQAAGQGDLEAVKDIVKRNPQKVRLIVYCLVSSSGIFHSYRDILKKNSNV